MDLSDLRGFQVGKDLILTICDGLTYLHIPLYSNLNTDVYTQCCKIATIVDPAGFRSSLGTSSRPPKPTHHSYSRLKM